MTEVSVSGVVVGIGDNPGGIVTNVPSSHLTLDLAGSTCHRGHDSTERIFAIHSKGRSRNGDRRKRTVRVATDRISDRSDPVVTLFEVECEAILAYRRQLFKESVPVIDRSRRAHLEDSVWIPSVQFLAIEIGKDDLSSRRTMCRKYKSNSGANSHRARSFEGLDEVHLVAAKHHEIDGFGEFITESGEDGPSDRPNINASVGGQGEFRQAGPYAVGSGTSFLYHESEGPQGAEQAVCGGGHYPEQLSSIIHSKRATFADGFNQQERVLRRNDQIRIGGFLHSGNATTTLSRGGK